VKIKVSYDLIIITVALQEAVSAFIVTYHRILLKTRNSSTRFCRRNQNTYFLLNKSFSENRVVYEIMCENW